MECKFANSLEHIGNIAELIDTLWNVNITQSNLVQCEEGELIDTLWNVNTTYDVEDRETTWN